LANAVKLKIAFEISQIDELIEKSSVLLQKCILQEPDFIELNAAGAILHSYYNGLENIFLLIRKNIDKTVLSSERWHSELLKSMFAATEARRPLFEKNCMITCRLYGLQTLFQAYIRLPLTLGFNQTAFDEYKRKLEYRKKQH